MGKAARAIVLRRIAYGEADWIVTFLDREHGRMSGIARSARSSIKRFGGALEPGTQVELSIARRGAGLVRIEEARVVAGTLGAMKSLERIAALARALELALAFLQEHQPAPEKFDLLAERIAAIAAPGPEPAIADGVLFELEWLRRSGFGPQLAGCASCDATGARAKNWQFDFDRGGVLCSSCARGVGRRVRLAGETLAGLAAFDAGCRPEGEGAVAAAGAVVARYIDHVLGRPLKAWSV